jgi:hypothetical protein
MDPSLEVHESFSRPHFFIGVDASKSVNREDLVQLLSSRENELKEMKKIYGDQLNFFLMQRQSALHRDYDSLFQNLKQTSMEVSELSRSVEDRRTQLELDEYPVFFLFTDGNETEVPQSRLAGWSSQRVHLIFAKTNQADSFFLESVDIPSEVLKGRPIPISVVSHSLQRGKARIKILVNDIEEKSEEIELRPGLNFSYDSLPEKPVGHYKISVEINPLFVDENQGNHVLIREVQVYEPDRILVLETPGKGNFLSSFLKEKGYRSKFLDPANLDPQSALEGYSAILIHDVPYKKLPTGFDNTLREFVRQGGGLGFLGGEDSYGPGGYFRTPVEETLPVYMPPRSYRRSFALFFIIDSSGSMISEDKSIWTNPIRLLKFRSSGDPSSMPIHVAREASKKMINELVGVDIAVVHFNDRAMLAVPLQTVTPDNLETILSGVDSIHAGGGTRFYPAIKGALGLLVPGVYKEVKILFLSDGSPADRIQIPGLLDELRSRTIELTSIAFGRGADFELLTEMAEATGGKAYHAEDTLALAKTFEDAVGQVFGPPVVREARPVAWVENQTFLKETEEMLPEILGFVSTTPKARAEMVWVSGSGDPIFANWRFGLGRSFAWTSDLTGHWSKNFLELEVFRGLLNKAVGSILRKKSDWVRAVSSRRGREIRVHLRSLSSEGEYIDDLEPEGRIGTRVVSFQSLGEGEYLGVFQESRPGNHILKVEGTLGTGQFMRDVPFNVPLGVEESFRKSNLNLKQYYEQKWPEGIVGSSDSILSISKGYKQSSQREFRSFAILFLGLGIFFLCVDILFRRFRVLEGLAQQDTKEDKLPRLAEHSLRMARLSLQRGDLQEAERFFLSAHRHFQKAGMLTRSRDAWDEFRVKIR